MHADLRRWAAPLSILPAMMTNRRMVAINNAVADRLLVGRDLKGLDCRTVEVPSSGGTHRIRTRVYRPADHDGPLPVLVYVHGGGYCIGSLDSHRSMLTHLASAVAGRVLAVDYRLAPEHSFPAALDDACAAYRWVVAGGADPDRVVIAGDSAGGGLTLATLVALRDAGDPLPAAGVCLSPWADLTQSGATMSEKADADPMVHAEDLALGGGLRRHRPRPRCPRAQPALRRPVRPASAAGRGRHRRGAPRRRPLTGPASPGRRCRGDALRGGGPPPRLALLRRLGSRGRRRHRPGRPLHR